MRDTILKAVKKASGVEEPQVEAPELAAFGDYSTNVAMLLAKKEGKNPQEVAKQLLDKILNDEEIKLLCEKVEIAGPGFINFWLKKDSLLRNLEEIIKSGEAYGKSEINKGRKVMFEYGQPNTHKLPHIGHLFSYIYGESVTRLLEAVGWEVRRVNYQGDVGLNVAKCLWSFQKEKPITPNSLDKKASLLQEMYQKGSTAYEEDKKAKKEIQELNKKIYERDSSIFDLWQETRNWSLGYYKEFEERLGIKFERYFFESEVGEKGKEKVLQNIPKVFKKSQGAIIFEGSKFGLHDRVFVTKDGNPTYEAKDLYLEELKIKEWAMDLMIITTANEQNDYFKVVFRALEEIHPEIKGMLKHIGFGMINLKSGKMASRTGDIISAIDLVNEIVTRVGKIDKKSAEVVGLGAVKYSFLKNNPQQNVSFDIDESIAAEGNSGPYLQYTYVRTISVLGKSSKKKADLGVPKIDKPNPEELAVLRFLARFPETVQLAASIYSPNLLTNYLFELAQKYNNFYNQHKIIGGENEEFKLALTSGTGIVLKSGLALLGITAPQKM